MFKRLLTLLRRNRSEAPTAAPVPAPTLPCGGCVAAIHRVAAGEAAGALCTDCGQWWGHAQHVFFYPANPASSTLTKH